MYGILKCTKTNNTNPKLDNKSKIVKISSLRNIDNNNRDYCPNI